MASTSLLKDMVAAGLADEPKQAFISVVSF
jgi:hypothetical protein